MCKRFRGQPGLRWTTRWVGGDLLLCGSLPSSAFPMSGCPTSPQFFSLTAQARGCGCLLEPGGVPWKRLQTFQLHPQRALGEKLRAPPGESETTWSLPLWVLGEGTRPRDGQAASPKECRARGRGPEDKSRRPWQRVIPVPTSRAQGIRQPRPKWTHSCRHPPA